MNSTLRLENVSVSARSTTGHNRFILRDIHLSLQTGDRIGLLGQNGSGKTTLARVFCGLTKPNKGRVTRSPKKCRTVLALQRAEDLFVKSTVAEQLRSYIRGKAREEDIEALMESVGLGAEYAERRLIYLSGGEQRLVAIACALATGADFIVLDEPFAGLDSAGRHRIGATLKDLANRRSIGMIIISHHPDDLLGIAEKLWVLQESRVVYSGDIQSVPVNILDRCLGSNDGSIFHLMRRFEEHNYRLPDAIYRCAEPQELALQLEKAFIK
jgi:energy-coupling factor transport system ATP-binding protein